MKAVAKKVEIDSKFVIIALALMVIASVGTGFTAYVMLTGTFSPAKDSEVIDPNKVDIGPTFALDDFTVNLADTNPIRFVRTGIVLEADSEDTLAELERRVPQIRDHVISVLRSYSVSQLTQVGGLDNLRGNIREKINKTLISGEITDIFFVDLVVQ